MIRSTFSLPLLLPLAALLSTACMSPDGVHGKDATELLWRPVSVAPLGDASLRGLSIPKDGVIWISGSGGVVAVSEDGGTSWRDAAPREARRDGLDLRSIHAVDARTAWVASAGEGSASRVLHTNDGGRTWITQHRNTDADGFFDSIRFWDASNGMLMGDPVDGYLTVLTTNDGGKTWKRVPRESLPTAVEGEYGFAASNRSIAVQGRRNAWIGTGGSVARMLGTRDAGYTWFASDVPVRQGDPAAGVFAVAFANAHHGVAVGGKYTEPDSLQGNCAWTQDGGKTWTRARTPPRGYRSSVAPSPIDRDLWLTVGINGSDVSFDRGRTWAAIGGWANEELNAIAFSPGGLRAWAIGPEGAVRRMDL